MAEPARDEDELTPEEREQLRALAPLLPLLTKLVRRAASAEVVDSPEAKPVRRDREPPPEAFDRVSRLRRRKGIRGDG